METPGKLMIFSYAGDGQIHLIACQDKPSAERYGKSRNIGIPLTDGDFLKELILAATNQFTSTIRIHNAGGDIGITANPDSFRKIYHAIVSPDERVTKSLTGLTEVNVFDIHLFNKNSR